MFLNGGFPKQKKREKQEFEKQKREPKKKFVENFLFSFSRFSIFFFVCLFVRPPSHIYISSFIGSFSIAYFSFFSFLLSSFFENVPLRNYNEDGQPVMLYGRWTC